ncbi:MAG: YggS family pyridoxal phosphate enzyme [Candidatus Sericytochromatia bacterium]|nr:MAG: YggS family pyridoxal phosphate enzyme [Candidatus Sericytochromatia bacterium]
MLDIEKNAFNILNSIPPNVELVLVTKTISLENILKVLNCGIKNIGENKVQEALIKYDVLKNHNIKFHLIGHLQKNKVNKAVRIFDLIQSVDSLEIASLINDKAKEINKVQDILIQINISEEETKSGFLNNDNLLDDLFKISKMKNINVKGLMTIAKNTQDENILRNNFSSLRNIKENINNKNIFSNQLEILSMGMSNDYKIAIEEGSNMIRLGRAIFGERL